jgi:purine-binding chemotaxis protein CheW
MPIQDKRDRPDANKSLVGFVVGKVAYAVPISSVREIINATDLTELPHLPRSVAGVADHRGEVIPVVDLRTRFGLPRNEDLARSKWILVDVSGQTVGLVVDRVTEVFGTGNEGYRVAPSFGDSDDARGISGVVSYDGHLVFVLDVGRFEQLVQAIPEEALLAAAVAGEGP